MWHRGVVQRVGLRRSGQPASSGQDGKGPGRQARKRRGTKRPGKSVPTSVDETARRYRKESQGTGRCRWHKIAVDIKDQVGVIRYEEAHVPVGARRHNRRHRFDPAIRVERGSQRLRLSARESRQKPKRAVRHHRDIEGVSLRCIGYVASAARNCESPDGLSTQKRPAKRTIRKSSIGHSARSSRDETERGRRGSSAVAKLGAGNSSAPVESTVGLHVFTGKPKGAIVTRINLHGAIVPPPRKSGGLRPRSRHNHGFRLHRARSVRECSSGNGE